MIKTSKKGFTLAEVLTTLMVIGVVAAMTIPTLLNSTDEQQKKVAFKKAISVLGQGAQLMVAKEVNCTVTNSATLASCMASNVLSGSLTDATNTSTSNTDRDVVITGDGLAYRFIYNGESDTDFAREFSEICGTGSFKNTADSWTGSGSPCMVVIDVNGLSKGSRNFASGGYSSASTSAIKGTDQFMAVITGAGVRPVYVSDGGSNSFGGVINKGYEYMYGSGTPNTAADSSGGSGS